MRAQLKLDPQTFDEQLKQVAKPPPPPPPEPELDLGLDNMQAPWRHVGEGPGDKPKKGPQIRIATTRPRPWVLRGPKKRSRVGSKILPNTPTIFRRSGEGDHCRGFGIRLLPDCARAPVKVIPSLAPRWRAMTRLQNDLAALDPGVDLGGARRRGNRPVVRLMRRFYRPHKNRDPRARRSTGRSFDASVLSAPQKWRSACAAVDRPFV